MTGPITAEAVVASRADMQPDGERYCELAMTGAIVAGATPLERRDVAAFLRGVLARPPLATGATYEAHRAILGGLLLELETFALADAGDVVAPDAADLRAPAVVARERAAIKGFRDWAELERTTRTAAYHAHVDEMLEPSGIAHEQAEAELAAAVDHATTEAPQADDPLAFL